MTSQLDRRRVLVSAPDVVEVVREAVPDLGPGEVVVGERVTVEPTLVWGHCKPCRHGAENLCENLEFFGCGYREGGMDDVFSVPAGRLRKIPTTFSDYEAAFVEPLATPVHAVRLAGDLAGKTGWRLIPGVNEQRA